MSGGFFWTFAEYMLHRFLFHGEDHWMKILPFNRWVYTFHFTFHGIHHAFPQDRLRLVMPLVPAYAISYGIFSMVAAVIPEGILYTFMFGFFVGYILYDEFHWFMHHSNPKWEYLKKMKIYHMQHHYKFGQIGFGVSNKFWDGVFNTSIEEKQKKTA